MSTREGVIQQLPDVDGDPTPFCGLTAHGNEACKSPLAFCRFIKLELQKTTVAAKACETVDTYARMMMIMVMMMMMISW